MSDWENKTDLQINNAVAEKLGLHVSDVVLFGSVQIKDEFDFWCSLDPCNSWADAGPVIEEYGITIKRYSSGSGF